MHTCTEGSYALKGALEYAVAVSDYTTPQSCPIVFISAFEMGFHAEVIALTTLTNDDVFRF